MEIPISCDEAQRNFEKLCDRVVETGEAVIISRPDGNNVALVSEAELSSLLETLYLLRSPANASRLQTALTRAKEGIVKPQTIDELYQQFGLGDENIAVS